MKYALFFSLLLFLATSSGIISCKKSGEPAPSLEGTWRLTNRSCYCPPAPTPQETITFTGNRFSTSLNGSLSYEGSYSSISTSKCGKTKAKGVRLLRDSAPNIKVAPQEAIVTRTGNTLVLDYNTECLVDGPVDTYELLP
jgi:hypothetical protein